MTSIPGHPTEPVDAYAPTLVAGEAPESVMALTILAHPDARRVGEVARLGLLTALSRTQPLFAPHRGDVAPRPLEDPHLSRSRAVTLTRDGDVLRVTRDAGAPSLAVDGAAVEGTRELPWKALRDGVLLEFGPNVTLLLHVLPAGVPGLEPADPSADTLAASEPPGTVPSAPPPPVDRPSRTSGSPPRDPSTVTDQELVDALRAHGWKRAPTARALGVGLNALYTLIDRCPLIRKAQDVPEAEVRAAHGQCGGDLQRMSERLEVPVRSLLLRVWELGL